MAYIIYLDGVALPIAPSKIQTKIKNQNKTINLINDGEVNILKDAGLTEFSFDVTIPHVRYPFAVYPNGFKPASFFLDKFEKLKVNKKPFQFICSRTSPSGQLLFDTNIKVGLEDYQITEDVKEGQDLEVTVNLKQYKEFGTKLVNITTQRETKPTATVKPSRPAETAPALKIYTVKAGDSLWAIAQKYMGNGSRYPDLYNANKTTIDNRNKGTGNPKYTIYPGQVFTIPS
jgi:LysM repeat protein